MMTKRKTKQMPRWSKCLKQSIWDTPKTCFPSSLDPCVQRSCGNLLAFLSSSFRHAPSSSSTTFFIAKRLGLFWRLKFCSSLYVEPRRFPLRAHGCVVLSAAQLFSTQFSPALNSEFANTTHPAFFVVVSDRPTNPHHTKHTGGWMAANVTSTLTEFSNTTRNEGLRFTTSPQKVLVVF